MFWFPGLTAIVMEKIWDSSNDIPFVESKYAFYYQTESNTR